jgi:hypothetical protein
MTSKILRFLLNAAMIFLAVSGLYGGISLLIDPSGNNIQLSTSLLENTLFDSYFIPGITLLLFLGLLPGFVAYGLISKQKSRLASKLNLYKKRHWAWTFSLYCGIILVIWIDIQVMLIGGGYTIQTVYALLGVLILILSLTPEVMRFYKKGNK